MRQLLSLLLLLAAAATACAQWTQTGGYAYAKPGTTVGSAGDLLLSGGTFRNRGRVQCQSLQADSAATLRGTGLWYVRENLATLGALLENSTFVLSGAPASSLDAGGNTFYRLWLEKDAASLVNLAAPLAISSQLRFNAPDNQLQLNGHDLTLQASSGAIAGADATRFVVTNGAGRLVRENLGTAFFKFPVGSSPDAYNLLQINNIGTADAVAVRCLPEALMGGNMGAAFTSDAVAAAWEVTESVPGGSVLALKASWSLADELPGFTRQQCALRLHDGAAWQPAPLGPATGSGPYTRTRTGVAQAGVFAVLDASVPLAAPDERAAESSPQEVRVEVSPNPASEVARVRAWGAAFSQAVEIQLFDRNGHLLWQEKFSGAQPEITLRVADLPSGEYLVRAHSGDAAATARFVKI